MKVIILAGGYGTRLSEETDLRPKPMVEIGGYPIIYHIMKIYSYYGFNDFIIALGYKGYIIKEYFANYLLHNSDVSIDLPENKIEILNKRAENWKVTLVDTGLDTQTGGRIKRLQTLIGKNRFMLTYGDGVSNVDIHELLKFHESHGKYVTVTAVKPGGKYGQLEIEDGKEVRTFMEKPPDDGSWVNGGFFVLEPEAFDYIDSDETMWESTPLEKLASDGQLIAYKHSGFWKCMDTLKDKRDLERMWLSENAKWAVWVKK
ncbi:MAG: glucose-1-phosphate cytidylyltransferase [Candidatus Thermoplasmatota archaeon]|nr:glucose-1-phosphate cytidylyltransferase [Candidatus Thermoplasmatota archaeon]